MGPEAASVRFHRVRVRTLTQSRKCYLLPVAPLQRAWRLFGRQWIDRHGQRRARNDGYVSASVPVPIQLLMAAMAEAMLIQPAVYHLAEKL